MDVKQKAEYTDCFNLFKRIIDAWLDIDDDTYECRVDCEHETPVTKIVVKDIINFYAGKNKNFRCDYSCLWEDKDNYYPTFNGYIFRLNKKY